MDLKNYIREVQDFPKEGIGFKDITTLLNNGEVFKKTIDMCVENVSEFDFDVIVGPEARGFIVAAPMSYALSKSFVPIRKPGKLPSETVSIEYELEYGVDKLEIHKDAIKKGQKVLIADDLLATGGTVNAIVKLIESMGAEVVGMVFIMELSFLNARDLIGDYNIKSLIKY
ncbi:adenine phosphoribosyltransferase [Helicovermis profundi]|uniref:Adenine phosphoribosyltransferase n=1 Tax=Helicovermis profundi TaxID=3065157 RepID=A0AAU9ECN0_9FIRM|nr:adenine phosphoribosyltransferase [Clostridia bacterium S502]